mgnify:CR=1 FL=1
MGHAPDPTPATRWPVFALALVAVGAALAFTPRASAALEFVRARLLAGELWRLLTGHLVHASPGLAWTDLVVLLFLGAWWERRSRAALGWILLASALGASVALLACTSFERYTGSSALGSGLFVAAALVLVLERRAALRLAGGLALALFAAKCALEASGMGVHFVSLPAGSEVAASAHAAGGAGGALVALVRCARSPRRA